MSFLSRVFSTLDLSTLDPSKYSTKKDYLNAATTAYNKYKEDEKKKALISKMDNPTEKPEKQSKGPSAYNIYVARYVQENGQNNDKKPRDLMKEAAIAWQEQKTKI